MLLTAAMSGVVEQLTSWPVLVLVAVGYLCAANMLRFTRMEKMQSQYGYHTRESLKDMKIEDAQKV